MEFRWESFAKRVKNLPLGIRDTEAGGKAHYNLVLMKGVEEEIVSEIHKLESLMCLQNLLLCQCDTPWELENIKRKIHQLHKARQDWITKLKLIRMRMERTSASSTTTVRFTGYDVPTTLELLDLLSTEAGFRFILELQLNSDALDLDFISRIVQLHLNLHNTSSRA
jgi:hypothetical protein